MALAFSRMYEAAEMQAAQTAAIDRLLRCLFRLMYIRHEPSMVAMELVLVEEAPRSLGAFPAFNAFTAAANAFAIAVATSTAATDASTTIAAAAVTASAVTAAAFTATALAAAIAAAIAAATTLCDGLSKELCCP